MTDHYAVVGNPVAHSVSPRIHAEFARQTGQVLDYVKLLVPLDAFAAGVEDFCARGGSGVNVTLPFKHAAWHLAAARGYAINARAVNTIKFEDGKAIGYNTDGIGLVRDIRDNLRCAIAGKRILLLGAGGATYGVVEPLLQERPAQLQVLNRTRDKAVALVAHFGRLDATPAANLALISHSELQDTRFDIVINATSAGLSNQMPPLPGRIFAAGALAYDMVYGKLTPFMKFAHEHGAAQVADGLGMLVEQAAESFYIWRRVRPDSAPVIATLRQS